MKNNRKLSGLSRSNYQLKIYQLKEYVKEYKNLEVLNFNFIKDHSINRKLDDINTIDCI